MPQLIKVEFDGQPAHPAIFNALQIYLQNIGVKFCTEPLSQQPMKFNDDWQRLLESVSLIERAIKSNDQALLDFIVRATRLQIQNIYNRYGIAQDDGIDAAIAGTSVCAGLVASKRQPYY